MINPFGDSKHNRFIWYICILLFASGCSKAPGNNDINSKDVPLKYALIGDTLFPMLPYYEVYETSEKGRLEVGLEKDLDQGNVVYRYVCEEVHSTGKIDLKEAEKRYEELNRTINESDFAVLEKVSKKYVEFKGIKAVIFKSQLRYRDEKKIDTKQQSMVFNFNGKQYRMYMFNFEPTESTQAYSNDVWGKLSEGIILLESNKDKIECLINKIDINNEGMKIEFTITNKSPKLLKINRQTLLHDFSRIKLHGYNILEEPMYQRVTYLSPYLSSEYITLEADKKYTFTNNIDFDGKQINPKLVELLASGNSISVDYTYKADVVLMREPKKLFIQTIGSKGVAEATYSNN